MAFSPRTMQSLRRRFVLSSLAAGILPLALGCATEVQARQSSVEMSIIDRDSGQPLNVYHQAGRAHVAGSPGSRYALRLTNRSSGRRLVVLSVDGVNVVSGETAGWGQAGYVLDPWQSFDIAGWRKSNSVVAAFEFAALSDSYAARTGRPDNVGVIGMAVFFEKPNITRHSVRPQAPAQLESAPSAAAKSSAERRSALGNAAADAQESAAAPSERLGTAHGQREWSLARQTRFERLSSQPQSVVEIAYDSYQNLVAAGVIPANLAQAQPRPFPLSHERGRFVADPPPR